MDSRFKHLGRRARAIAIGMAIAGISVGFTACGDDEDEANQSVDELQEQIESGLDDVDTEELQQQAEDAQEQIESAIDDVDTEALQQQAEEAQKQAEELQDQYGN
jgi:predicted  nucleic acid-binding Zn-ribbon protein